MERRTRWGRGGCTRRGWAWGRITSAWPRRPSPIDANANFRIICVHPCSSAVSSSLGVLVFKIPDFALSPFRASRQRSACRDGKLCGVNDECFLGKYQAAVEWRQRAGGGSEGG